MPVFSKLYDYLSNSQGFIAASGTNTTLAWSGASGNPAGCLSMIRAVKAATSATSTWSITGTFQNAFGLSSGATITSIVSASMQWRCVQFTSANTSTSGPATITYAGTGVTLSNATTFGGTGAAFATVTGAGASGLNWPATGTFTIAITGTLANANTTGSTVSLDQDQLAFSFNYLQPVSMDYSGTTEFIGNIYSDSFFRSEFLGFLQYSKPFDTLSSQRSDSFGPIEFLRGTIGQTRDSLVPIEFASTTVAAVGLSGHSILQVEFTTLQNRDWLFYDELLSSKVADIIPYIEYVGVQSKDHLVPLEELSNWRSDYNNPISLVASFNGDSRVIVEEVSRQNQDIIQPFEALSRQSNDNTFLLEEGANRRLDYNNPISVVGNLRNDIQTPVELIVRQNQDSISPLTVLSRQLKDALSLSEYSSISSTTSDALALMEFVADRSVDSKSVLEWLNNQIGDSTPRLEALFGNIVDTILNQEFLALLRGDSISIEEFSSTFSTDRLANKEFLSIVKPADQLALVESLFGNKADYLAVLSVLNRISSDTNTVIEWLGETLRISDIISPIEWRTLVLSLLDSKISIEFISNLVNDQKVLSEIIGVGARSDSLVGAESFVSLISDKLSSFEELIRSSRGSSNLVEWFGGIGVTTADSLAPIEIQRLLIGDVAIQAELGVQILSVLSDALVCLEVLGLLPSHIRLPVETVGRFNTDIISLQSWLGATSSDRILRLETLFGQTKDYLVPSEYVSQTLVQATDALLPIEFRRLLFGDNTVDLETLGTTAVIWDSIVPIEFGAASLLHLLLQNEFQTLASHDNMPQQSWGKSVRFDNAVGVELLSRIISDNIIRDEYISSTVARYRDTLLPIEFGLRAQSDSTFMLEASISLFVDNNGLLEFVGVPLKTLLSSFGRLSSPRGKIRISYSPGKVRISIPLKKIRIT